jgi:hypothetical protein
MKYIAVIGSRDIPNEYYDKLADIVRVLQRRYIIRSGGANGSDHVVTEYVAAHRRQIYIPWDGFNGLYDSSQTGVINAQKLTSKNLSYELAEKYHPYWHNLKDGAKRLMARNSHQVMGMDMETPVDFIVCYTKSGKATGGTGQAIRIAEKMNIPVYNIKNEEDYKKLKKEVLI